MPRGRWGTPRPWPAYRNGIELRRPGPAEASEHIHRRPVVHQFPMGSSTSQRTLRKADGCRPMMVAAANKNRKSRSSVALSPYRFAPAPDCCQTRGLPIAWYPFPCARQDCERTTGQPLHDSCASGEHDAMAAAWSQSAIPFHTSIDITGAAFEWCETSMMLDSHQPTPMVFRLSVPFHACARFCCRQRAGKA